MFKLTRLLTSLLLVTGLPLAVAKSHSLTLSPRINSSSSLLSGEWLIVQKQKRVALVIGNAAYPEDSLKNPVNDAIDVAKALTDIGFDVTLLENADRRKIHDAVKNFNRRLSQGEIGLFYYAGHGVQVAGENYLIPVDAKLDSESDVDIYSYPLKAVISAMETANVSVKIIILDACRNNLFLRSWGSNGRSLSSRGLAEVKRSGRGTLISYATAPGEVAGDSLGKGRNSPYTAHLLKYLKAPNLEIGLMFRRVRDDVLQATNDRQVPWVSESLVGEVYLNPQPIATSSPSPPKPTPELTPPPPKTPPSNPPTEPRSTLISSTTGVDYTPLRQILQQKKWKEADDITFKLMLESSKHQNQDWTNRDWLTEKAINSFACEDLKIIDQLWFENSNKQLGLSAQLKFWNDARNNSTNLIENYRKFAELLEWIRPSIITSGSSYISSDDINYTNPPQGHLPVQITYPLEKGWLNWGSDTNRHWLYSRFTDCLKKSN
jgi:hypothetical protein